VVTQAIIITTTQICIGIFVFLSGVFATLWRMTAQAEGTETAISHLLGPLGALAFALLAIYVLVKYLQRKEKQLEDVQQRFLEDAIKEKEFWREQATQKDEQERSK